MIKNIALKSILMAFATLIISSSVLLGQKTKAANSPISGKCAGVFSARNAADGPIALNKDEDVNVGLILDFDAMKVSIAHSNQKLISGADDVWKQNVMKDKSFTMKADPDGLDGSYEIVLNFSDPTSNSLIDQYPTFRLFSVNSGNTFLIQGKTFSSVGVCQKV